MNEESQESRRGTQTTISSVQEQLAIGSRPSSSEGLSKVLYSTGFHLEHRDRSFERLGLDQAPSPISQQSETPEELDFLIPGPVSTATTTATTANSLASKPSSPDIEASAPGSKTPVSAPPQGTMAAIAAIVVPIVLSGLQKAVPIVIENVKKLIDQAVAKFQAAHPGQSVWQVFGAAIAHLWRDNRIDKKIYDALHLGSFVAKISNFSKALIHRANIDPKLITPPDVVANWDTAKLIEMLAGVDENADPATIRKAMLKYEPVGTMVGMLNKDKFPIPGDIKSHVIDVFNNFNKLKEPQKPPPPPSLPESNEAASTRGTPVNAESGISADKPITPSNPTTIPDSSSSKLTDVSRALPADATKPSPTPGPTTTTTTTNHDKPVDATQTPIKPDAIKPVADETPAETVTPETKPTNSIAPVVSPAPVNVPHVDLQVSALQPLDTPPVDPLPPKPSLTPRWLAAHPEALANVPENDQPAVVHAIKSMLRVSAISPNTTAMQELMKNGAPTSKAIVRNSKAAWVAANAPAMGVTTAQTVYNNAQDQAIRLENMTIGLLELVRGSGLARSDDGANPATRKLKIQDYLSKRGYNLSLEALFGSMDDATAPESRTVYSPAAYFVELLGYLRNNNMDPASIVSDTSTKGKPDSIDGTVLQSLFRRRPDLGNLELTPENSDTVLPYIDLVNEVMESFIVNLPAFRADGSTHKQAEIDVYNVTTEDSTELLSQPQNVSISAYRQLAAAVYPTSLPYHQPLDMQRIFLNYLTVPRAELADTFRPKPPTLSAAAKSIAIAKGISDPLKNLTDLQKEALDRQVDCERLGLVQEEYLILTKNVFWKPEFFSLTEGIEVSPESYTKRIGLRSTAELWGYNRAATLLDDNQSKRDGLQFVKKQLLPRSGIAYTDLIDIVQTSFVNPNFPSGRDKTILESLQFSYTFLSTLIDEGSTSASKYGRLASFLARSQKIINLSKLLVDVLNETRPQENGKSQDAVHIRSREILKWVASRFESLGEVIVLDINQGPQLEITGVLTVSNTDASASDLPILPGNTTGSLSPTGLVRDAAGIEHKAGPIGILSADGNIKDVNGKIFARVNIAGRVIYGNPIDDTDLNTMFPQLTVTLTVPGEGTTPWVVTDGYLKQLSPNHVVEWTLNPGLGGSASLEDVRLVHLNGASLTMIEWERLHLFIRIWRKLGWSIEQTDRALTGINACLIPSATPTKPVDPAHPTTTTDEIIDLDELITFDNFSDLSTNLDSSTNIDGSGNGSGSSKSRAQLPDITPAVIRELAALTQLVNMTGLPVDQLLTMWTDLSSKGPKSLFYRFVFSRRAGSADAAFAPDTNGDHFTGKPTKISDHRPAVMAAFSLPAKDLDILLGLTQPGVSPVLIPDLLNMKNLSSVYSAVLFVRILGVSVQDLTQIAAAFVDPAPDPANCLVELTARPTRVLKILQTWTKINNASFSWNELRYILDSVPSPLDPLAPTEIDALRLAKTLHDGILEIQAANPFVTAASDATDDLIKSKTSFIFDTETVAGILNLINGTTVYTTSAPVIKDKNFPTQVTTLIPGAKYITQSKSTEDGASTQSAKLQVTGILSNAQKKSLEDLVLPLCNSKPLTNGSPAKPDLEITDEDDLRAEWKDSIERASAQSTNFFYDALVDIFPAAVLAEVKSDPLKMVLLAPDLTAAQVKEVDDYHNRLQEYNEQLKHWASAERERLLKEVADGIGNEDYMVNTDLEKYRLISNPSAPSQPMPKAPSPPSFEGQTPQSKAMFFLQYFIPFLQARLAHTYAIDTVADAAGFSDHALAKTFLEKIIVMDHSRQSAIKFLLASMGTSTSVYQGYITPPSTGSFAFYIPDGNQPDPITLGSSLLRFTQVKVRSRTYWATKAVPLLLGEVYTIRIDSVARTKLAWKQDSNSIKLVTDTAFRAWRGFLNPSSLDSYAVSVISDSQPPSIELDNSTLSFSLQQLDPDKIYTTEKKQLDPTRLYPLTLVGLLPSDLFWKSSSSTRSAIPSSAFLPDYSREQTLKLFDKMKKMALVVSHFTLSSDELVYMHSRSASKDFDKLDFNSLGNISQWTRIYDYIALRKSLPAKTDQSLIDLFAWSNNHLRDADIPSGVPSDSSAALKKTADAQAALAAQISAATTWPVAQIQETLAHANFTTGQAPHFVNEVKLLLLRNVISCANRLGVEIPRIFEWTAPLGTNARDFFRYADVAQDIQKIARAKFDIDSWATAVRPLNDSLRENQKNALIAYLLVQTDLTVPNKITNADGLFEYFLIDVQMTSLVQTSRLKQATSSVQLFIQRCMLGLEESRGVKASALDRERWQWMQKYRVWEGNRKIFLYPENWIDPSLRDDKSELFTQLEAELLQKDLTKEAVNIALRNYLYSVKQIANLQCIGLYVDFQDSSRIHVFARTRAVPYAYYYNWYLPNGDDGFWNGWKRMEVDIPHYVVPETGLVGNYVAPVVFNGSLMLFIAQIMPYTNTNPKADTNTKFGDMNTMDRNDAKPITTWQIQMGWSEYRNSKWTPRQTCPSTHILSVTPIPIDPTKVAAAQATLKSAQAEVDRLAGIDQDLTQKLNALKTATDSGGIVPVPTIINIFTKQKADNQSLLEAARDALKKAEIATLASYISVPIDQFKIVPSIVQSPASKPSDLADSVKVYMLYADAGDTGVVWQYNGTQLSMLPGGPPQSLMASLPTTTTYGYTQPDGSLRSIHSWQAFESQVDSTTAVETTVLQTAPSVEDAEAYSYQPVRSLRYNSDLTVNNSLKASTVNTTGPSIWLYNRGTQASDSQQFYHSTINQLLQGTGGSDPSSIFAALANLPDPTAVAQVFGGSTPKTNQGQASMTFNERRTAYTLYNWELGLHAPMIVIDRLFKAAQYEQALQVCQYVFNPLSAGDSTDASRFWMFPPFKFVRTQTIEEYFLSFKPGQPNADVFNWRNKPFAPHVVARNRPQAYMKWVVMKYIQILIAWGDDLFRQNSLESIPLAIQCYVYASNIYGPRGQQYPRLPVKPETYNSLMTKLDAFDNAIVQLEEAFPFSNQTPLPVAKLPDDQSAQMANVFGSAATLYFAIPSNPNVSSLAATIDDRLFKIRHSQDINGVFRQLPLQDPPIDPGLLVLAAAQGLNLSSVLTDLNGPLPNCRFTYLLDKAMELTQEVKAFGGALLSNKEKWDGELLNNLRTKHELATNTSTLDIKQLSLDDANEALTLLQYQRTAAVSRLTHSLKLIGNDLSGIPQVDSDYIALIAKIDAPLVDGGIAISPAEKLEMDKLQTAADLNIGVGIARTAAGILSALPNVDPATMPLGMGVNIRFGPENFAKLGESIAAGLSIGVDRLNFEAGNAGKLNQHQREVQDRILTANATGFEISSIDKQITAAKIRIAMATRDISIQQQQIDQAREVNDFLHSKYTSVELYSWIDGQTKTLFYQTYSAAFALAMKAQKAFCFERPQKASTSFIKPGYWDASRDGLLSGETLAVALKQLEAAYMDERGYDYMVTKAISLRRLDPLALISLRETGSCQFTLPEVIFDMDFPGHYMRRIKSAAITIPCLVGPYTSINATLRLQTSRYRISPSNPDKYPEDTTPGADPDPRFSTSTVAIPAIAASSCVDDDGTFQLAFDENSTRFLPFEGAGAISTWTLELPQIQGFKQFDHDSITDVILRLKYTSLEGGVALRQNASKNVVDIIKSAEYSSSVNGLVALFDIKNDFASGWSRLTQAYGNSQHTPADLAIQLSSLNDRLPIFTAGRTPKQIIPAAVWIVTDQEVPGGSLSLSSGSGTSNASRDPVTLSSTPSSPGLGDLKCYSAKLEGSPVDTFGNWTLKFGEGQFNLGKCLMLVSYKLA